MAFSVNYGRPQAGTRRKSAPASLSRLLVTALVLFAMFCVYDYSPYGDGYVAHALGDAQRSFQQFMNRFRVRI